MSVTVNNDSPIQDYVHPDDQTQPTLKWLQVLCPNFKTESKSRFFSRFEAKLWNAIPNEFRQFSKELLKKFS